MAFTSRPYADDTDLARMQDLLIRSWGLGKPFENWTAGDLDWWRWQHEDDVPGRQIRLWFDGDDEPIAWAWLAPPDSLSVLDTHIAHGHRENEALLDDILGWFIERSSIRQPREDQVTSRVSAPRRHPTAWAFDAEMHMMDALARNAFRPTEETLAHTIRPLSEPIPEPRLPPGYRVRSVKGMEEIEARVAVHRAAWEPSRVTVASYANVMRSRMYRPELDVVAVAPDGSFAASVVCWFDQANGVAELEPVGTHPDHRRKGLARAASLEALRRARDLGADTGLVDHEPANVAASTLYMSMGFRPVARHVRFMREG